jgi:glycosyltransferase involved in cell wall biosynthesis
VTLPKVAIIHPRLVPGGGSEAKPVWMMEALKNDYEVYLITMGEVNLDVLNEAYGTEIKQDEIKIISVPIPLFFRIWFDALRGYRLARFCKRNSSQFDLMISTYNLMDFGTKGIQLIADFSFDDQLRRTLHPPLYGYEKVLYHKSIFRSVYLKLGKILSGFSQNGWKYNLTIANSAWSSRIMRDVYGVQTLIIYPPVASEFTDVAWEEKENGMVFVGRLVPEKRVDKVLEILGKVRERGLDVHLHILGRSNNTRYAEYLKKLFEINCDWVFTEGPMFGHRKLRFIAQHKFGISGCVNEAFGIAVAEMVKAGCIPWVPNGGGQVEIVNHPSLIYDDIDDAVNKIERVLRNSEIQTQLREYLSEQGKKFSIQRFKTEIRQVIEYFCRENARIQQ